MIRTNTGRQHIAPAAVRIIRSEGLSAQLKEFKEIIAKQFSHVLFKDEPQHLLVCVGPHSYGVVESAIEAALIKLKI